MLVSYIGVLLFVETSIQPTAAILNLLVVSRIPYVKPEALTLNYFLPQTNMETHIVPL